MKVDVVTTTQLKLNDKEREWLRNLLSDPDNFTGERVWSNYDYKMRELFVRHLDVVQKKEKL